MCLIEGVDHTWSAVTPVHQLVLTFPKQGWEVSRGELRAEYALKSLQDPWFVGRFLTPFWELEEDVKDSCHPMSSSYVVGPMEEVLQGSVYM